MYTISTNQIVSACAFMGIYLLLYYYETFFSSFFFYKLKQFLGWGRGVGVNKAHTDRPQAYASLTTVYG